MHDQFDARPMVAFPGTEHHRLFADTNLYCLLTASWELNL